MHKQKYHKILHLPWSDGLQNDDRVIPTTDYFKDREVIVTLKMDGENTSMYSDSIHARSMDSQNHSSRNLVKGIHGSIRHWIAEDIKIVGENLYAKHSIYYTELPSYFMGFSYEDETFIYSWLATKLQLKSLGLNIVLELYQGVYDEEIIQSLYSETNKYYGGEQEGYVVRVIDGFFRSDSDKYMAKFVRRDHVQTNEHWMTQEIIPNKLKGK